MRPKLDDIRDPIEIEVLDSAVVAKRLLEIPQATQLTIEGDSVPKLKRQFKGELLKNPIHAAAGHPFKIATFAKTAALVAVLLPLLTGDGWSIYHLNLHDGRRWLVQGFDWGMGCCPVSFDGELSPVVKELLDSGVARPWCVREE